MRTKGFITLATGDEQYYKSATNLLKSYLLFHCKQSKYNIKEQPRLPFAILADERNKYTELFDDVIILENPTHSYADKISLLNNIPYDETIFIESDCLAYSDLNEYFELFKDADQFSVFGTTLPGDSKTGWFLREEAGKYKERIEFIPRFHSAVIYMKKASDGEYDKCSEMYNICSDINKNYDDYMIGGSREAIDDKLLAISSAAVGCKPTKLEMRYYLNYPQFFVNGWRPHISISKPVNSFFIKEKNELIENAVICHWSSDFTKRYLYKREVCAIKCILKNKSPFWCYVSDICYPFYIVNTYFYLVVFPDIIKKLSKIRILKKIWKTIKR